MLGEQSTDSVLVEGVGIWITAVSIDANSFAAGGDRNFGVIDGETGVTRFIRDGVCEDNGKGSLLHSITIDGEGDLVALYDILDGDYVTSIWNTETGELKECFTTKQTETLNRPTIEESWGMFSGSLEIDKSGMVTFSRDDEILWRRFESIVDFDVLIPLPEDLWTISYCFQYGGKGLDTLVASKVLPWIPKPQPFLTVSSKGRATVFVDGCVARTFQFPPFEGCKDISGLLTDFDEVMLTCDGKSSLLSLADGSFTPSESLMTVSGGAIWSDGKFVRAMKGRARSRLGLTRELNSADDVLLSEEVEDSSIVTSLYSSSGEVAELWRKLGDWEVLSRIHDYSRSTSLAMLARPRHRGRIIKTDGAAMARYRTEGLSAYIVRANEQLSVVAFNKLTGRLMVNYPLPLGAKFSNTLDYKGVHGSNIFIQYRLEVTPGTDEAFILEVVDLSDSEDISAASIVTSWGRRLINDFWGTNSISENARHIVQPLLSARSYLLPSPVKSVTPSVTEQGITPITFFLDTEFDLVALPEAFLNGRRPKIQDGEPVHDSLSETGQIPYSPVLPLTAEGIRQLNPFHIHRDIINRNRRGLRTVAVEDSESTSALFVWGDGWLAYAHHRPSGRYDEAPALGSPSNRSYETGLFLLGMVGVILGTKPVLARQRAKSVWA